MFSLPLSGSLVLKDKRRSKKRARGKSKPFSYTLRGAQEHKAKRRRLRMKNIQIRFRRRNPSWAGGIGWGFMAKWIWGFGGISMGGSGNEEKEDLSRPVGQNPPKKNPLIGKASIYFKGCARAWLLLPGAFSNETLTKEG
jgi:hypothetical protein